MIFAATLGLASILLAPVIPLALLGSVVVWIGANRFYDFMAAKLSRKGKRK